MSEGARKPRMVGINHVALEVGDIDAALAFYGAVFDFTLRGRGADNAFLDMGDQFLALAKTDAAAARSGAAGAAEGRHFGLVVDDRAAVRSLAEAAGARLLPGPFLDFLDPWGNRIEVVAYPDVQFSKTPAVLRGMRLEMGKSDKAIAELSAKNMAPES
jgi:catechol 2,3-dioxygenase-like lactoylglutathione lyase family enzyme